MAAAAQRPYKWDDYFTVSALLRGMKCFQQGQVFDLAFEDSGGFVVITAHVGRERRQPYEVEISMAKTPQGLRVEDSYCTCSVSLECKHVAAVFYAALALHPRLFEPGFRPPQIPPTATLSPPVRDWLRRLQQAAHAPAKPAKPAPAERLLYVLSVTQPNATGAQVRIACFKSRPLKDGRNGNPAPYMLNNCLKASPARFVTPLDIRIALLATHSRNPGWYGYSHEAFLPVEKGAEILKLLLETGRGYWDSIHAVLLKPGDPRSAQAEWRRDEAGSLFPGLKVTPPAAHVLPVDPPWYFDAETSECGPLQVDLPPAAVQTWLAAPKIPRAESTVLAEVLEKEKNSWNLPKPQPIEIVRPESAPPVPCLLLSTQKLQWWELPGGYGDAGLDGVPIHFARLSFDYQGVQIPADAELSSVERFDGQRLWQIQRDQPAEAAAQQALADAGFISDDRIFGYHRHAKLAGTLLLSRNSDDAWLKLGTTTLPNLRAAGWRIEFDPSFSFEVAEVADWYADAQEQGGANWFEVELGVQVGEEKINLLPVLLEALKTQREKFSLENLKKLKPGKLVPITLPDGRVLPFPAGRLRDILSVLVELFDPAALDKKGRLKLPKLRVAELAGVSDDQSWRWFGGETLKELAQRLKNFSGIREVPAPGGFGATLRGYQQDGLNWLQFLREFDLAGVLADDMGLGKTVQALAHLLVEKQAGRLDTPALVIAPTSLMVNWRQETERFAPDLRVLVLHGADRKDRFADIPSHDLVLTTYPLLPRDAEHLLPVNFHTVILDEAQFIKNPKTQWAQIVCQLQAKHRLCLTGTPMENHLGELWSLFNFLLPGFLGDETRFRALFRNPIEKGKSEDRRQTLARRVAPFLLRRRKEEVVKELPPKTEIAQNVELGGAQRDLYESIRLAMHRRVQEEVKKKGMSRSHIIILDALLKLRQVCCDPRLLKLESARKVEESAKLELLMDLLPEMLSEGRRILLFSQFTSMLELIEERLRQRKIEWVKLTGSTTDRATPVQRFQNGEVPLFLISLKAGGTGLNLTAADTVIHYDPWWNPAVENQATDRAHRIGQDKPVFVYKLLTMGTVEEKIVALQQRKRELVEGLLNEGAGQRLDLSAADLDFLFAPLG